MEYIVEAVSSILPKKRRKKLPRKIPFFDELLFIGSITNGTKTRWTDLRLEKRRRRRKGGGEAEEEARWRCTPRLACTRAPARVDKLIPALYRVIVKHAGGIFANSFPISTREPSPTEEKRETGKFRFVCPVVSFQFSVSREDKFSSVSVQFRWMEKYLRGIDLYSSYYVSYDFSFISDET